GCRGRPRSARAWRRPAWSSRGRRGRRWPRSGGRRAWKWACGARLGVRNRGPPQNYGTRLFYLPARTRPRVLGPPSPRPPHPPRETLDSPILLVLCNLPEIRSSGVPPGTAAGTPNLPRGESRGPRYLGRIDARRRATPGPNPSADPAGQRGEGNTGSAPATRRWPRIPPVTAAAALLIGLGTAAPVTAHAATPAPTPPGGASSPSPLPTTVPGLRKTLDELN